MPSTVRFVGKFAYQADAVRPRHRTPERLDIVAPVEYELRSVKASDLVADACVIRIPEDKDGRTRLRFAFAGYDGGLWSPLDHGAADARPGRASITLDEYASRFGERWIEDADAYFHVDPVRRAYAGDYAPTERGNVRPYPRGKTTLAEADINGEPAWSNRSEALRRHLTGAARDLLVVDGIVYVRRPDPVWAIRKDGDGAIPGHAIPRGGPGHTLRLTLPKFWLSSECEVNPQSFDDHFLCYQTVFRADREQEALATGLRAHGEILALDRRFLSRDDDAWTLYCRLGAIVRSLEPMFRVLPAEHVVRIKSMSDAYEGATMWDMTSLSVAKAGIFADLAAIAADLRTRAVPTKLAHNKKFVLAFISSCLDQHAPSMAVEDEAALTALAPGA